ncbi:hypothetical protein Taro_016998 [Colocasia esculenta]|uniref:Uncharacterized protein n=1 Tax=Colocasia esculenta TaxID=4460 RepID=A0A843ULW7_COLES|nr:hypothetical protein [Colocasia esculenta]
MWSHLEPTIMLQERNLGAGSEIFESDHVATRLKCRFQNGASRAVAIAGRRIICVIPKGCDNQCISTHAPQWNFGLGTEFCETNVLSTVSECRFQIVGKNNSEGVNISAIFVHPYLRLGEAFSSLNGHNF